MNKASPTCGEVVFPRRMDHARWIRLAAGWIVLASLAWSLAAADMESGYLSASWRDHEGIPESSVLAVAQSPDGYLWVGTPGGLLRFNGVDFTRAETFSVLMRLTAAVTFLETDRSGRLWACGDRHLAVYENGSWRPIDGTNVLARSVALSGSGQILVGGQEGELYTVEDDRLKAAPRPPGLMPTSVFCVTDAKDGQLWLANKGFIGRQTPSGWTQLGSIHSSTTPLLAAPARSGGLWVYVPGELQLFQADGSVKRFPAPNPDQPRQMMEDQSGGIWLATIAGGLCHFRPEGESEYINDKRGLYHNAIRCVIEDREGNIWAGGNVNGLSRLRPRQFFNLGRAEGLPESVVTAVTRLASGEILVGTHGGGIARIRDGRAQAEASTANDSIGKDVASLIEDRAGRIWIGSINDRLFVIEHGVKRPFLLPAAMGSSINQLMEDSRGRIWVGGSAGLAVIEGSSLTRCFTNSAIAGMAITALAEDPRSHTIWIGTHSHGVFQMDGQDLGRAVPLAGFPGQRIASMAMDSDGYLWIGSSEADYLQVSHSEQVAIFLGLKCSH